MYSEKGCSNNSRSEDRAQVCGGGYSRTQQGLKKRGCRGLAAVRTAATCLYKWGRLNDRGVAPGGGEAQG